MGRRLSSKKERKESISSEFILATSFLLKSPASAFPPPTRKRERSAPPHPTRVLGLFLLPNLLHALKPLIPLRQPFDARTLLVLLETPDHLADHDESSEKYRLGERFPRESTWGGEEGEVESEGREEGEEALGREVEQCCSCIDQRATRKRKRSGRTRTGEGATEPPGEERNVGFGESHAPVIAVQGNESCEADLDPTLVSGARAGDGLGDR